MKIRPRRDSDSPIPSSVYSDEVNENEMTQSEPLLPGNIALTESNGRSNRQGSVVLDDNEDPGQPQERNRSHNRTTFDAHESELGD